MTLIYFLILLSVIIAIHELGHLIAAKLCGVYCFEYSLGMGPKVWGHKWGETEYNLRLIPIGGYVAMAGDNEEQLYEGVEVPSHRTLKTISYPKRIFVMLAGIMMNILLAWVLFSGVMLYNGAVAIPPEPVVAATVENSPAQEAGLQAGDRIIKVEFADGTVIKPDTFDDILAFSQLYDGEMTYTVIRGEETLEYTMAGIYDETQGIYFVGIQIPPYDIAEVNIFNCFVYGAKEMWDMTELMFKTIGRMVQGIGLDQLSGPIGIYSATEQTASYGLLGLILLCAMLSLNVAIFNALPLPVLDGGRVVLCLYEWITRRPVNKKIETGLMVASMALLLLLMVFATWQDIVRLVMK